MSEFEKLCENFGVMKVVKRERYPREIQLSEEFLSALKKEFFHHKLEEDSSRPIKNYSEKFQKALRFHLSDLNERADQELEVMRQKFEEQNNQRVPEVDIEGEDKIPLPQNDAPKDGLPKKSDKDCKQKRIVLQRNFQSTPVKESEDYDDYKPRSRDHKIGSSMPKKSKHGGKISRWGTHEEIKDKKLRGKYANKRKTI
jgi:hypothetical protein